MRWTSGLGRRAETTLLLAACLRLPISSLLFLHFTSCPAAAALGCVCGTAPLPMACTQALHSPLRIPTLSPPPPRRAPQGHLGGGDGGAQPPRQRLPAPRGDVLH